MPEEEEYKAALNDITTIVKNIETKLVGDLDKKGLIGQVYDNTKSCKSNTESIEILEADDRKKLVKGLAIAGSFILMLIATIVNLLK